MSLESKIILLHEQKEANIEAHILALAKPCEVKCIEQVIQV